jgi:hypothetical protein
MPEYYINTAAAPVKLRHTSRRAQSVTIERGGLFCEANRRVIVFMLGLSGHLEAPDPGKVWDSFAVTDTSVGGRLVYLLADIRRPGDIAEHVARAFFHGLAQSGVGALRHDVEGARPATFSERYLQNQMTNRLAEPIGDRLTDKWRQLRPTTPNGYVNLATRKPAWRGPLTVDSSVSLAPLG